MEVSQNKEVPRAQSKDRERHDNLVSLFFAPLSKLGKVCGVFVGIQ